MRKLLIHSNSPLAPTGYGNQVGVFAPRLAAKRDPDYLEKGKTEAVAISAFYGLEGAPIRWKGIPILPGLGGEFGNDFIGQHADYFFDGPRNGLVMTLMDVWVLQVEVIRELNACSWVPVDHDPVPPMVANYFQQSGAIPIAMSRFGQEQLERFDPLYVPHGVDVDAYKPQPTGRLRERLGEDAFIVGMVAANKGAPSRKGFQQAFEAFRYFREKHENAYLYLHTDMNHNRSQGEDLGMMIASLQIPDEAVLLANQYKIQYAPYDAREMANLYSDFDVLINPSMGEGFGLPIIEAQACGTPAIVTDFSAMKEVCGAGWKVKCRPFWTGQRSWQAVPDVEEIVGALEEAESMPKAKRESLSVQARQHAMGYAADKVLTEHFLPALEEVEERLWKPKAPSVPAKVVKA